MRYNAKLETSTYTRLNMANYAYEKMCLLPAYTMDKSQHITYHKRILSCNYLVLKVPELQINLLEELIRHGSG